MKLTVTQDDLAYGLGIVSRSVAARSNLPVLANVLVEASEGLLRLTTTNLAIALVCVIPATVTESGETTIPATLFSDLIGTIPPGATVAITTEKGETLRLRSGLLDTQIKGIPASDFPAMTVISQTPLTRIAQGVLRKALEETVFAAASSDKVPLLNSVSAKFHEGDLTLVTTDNYRIAVKTIPILDPVAEDAVALIPAQGLTELIRVLTADEEDVKVVLAEAGNELMFSVAGIDVVCRLLSGAFPNYERAIPKEHATRVVIGREDLLGVARPAALIARLGSNVVTFRAQPDGGEPGVTLSAIAEIGQHVGRVEVGVEGAPTTIGMNARYLSEVLTNVLVDSFEITLNGTRGPAIFRPADDPSYLYLVSPVVAPVEGTSK